jgi:hypothetical protein
MTRFRANDTDYQVVGYVPALLYEPNHVSETPTGLVMDPPQFWLTQIGLWCSDREIRVKTDRIRQKGTGEDLGQLETIHFTSKTDAWDYLCDIGVAPGIGCDADLYDDAIRCCHGFRKTQHITTRLDSV